MLLVVGRVVVIGVLARYKLNRLNICYYTQ
jgi:hypothetical protein